MIKKICIIGTGQIGSRHLQALKAVRNQLDILIVDSSKESLKIGKERYDSMNTNGGNHKLEYTSVFPKNQNFEIAIIATSSGPRAQITKDLLSKNKVRYLILEKILFQRKDDYRKIEKLLNKNRVKTWVNCPMRMMPFYANLKKEFDKKITYILYGNRSGMATDLIHHIDYISFLTKSNQLMINPKFLDKKLNPSKRKGYFEITGTLLATYQDGSQLIIRSDAKGQSPKIVEIFDTDKRYMILENQGRVLVSKAPDWNLEEIKFNLPYQSQLTTSLVERLLVEGESDLPSYKESAKLHLQTFEPIRKFIKLDHYPFT